jgi:hypothetical protein
MSRQPLRLCGESRTDNARVPSPPLAKRRSRRRASARYRSRPDSGARVPERRAPAQNELRASAQHGRSLLLAPKSVSSLDLGLRPGQVDPIWFGDVEAALDQIRVAVLHGL